MLKNKIYTQSEIQKVYRRRSVNRHSVLISYDEGITWQTPCADSGKWFDGMDYQQEKMVRFAFVEPLKRITRQKFNSMLEEITCGSTPELIQKATNRLFNKINHG